MSRFETPEALLRLSAFVLYQMCSRAGISWAGSHVAPFEYTWRLFRASCPMLTALITFMCSHSMMAYSQSMQSLPSCGHSRCVTTNYRLHTDAEIIMDRE